MRKLVIIEGTDEREVELSEGKYYLGRLSSNQIQLSEGGVSRRHAKIEVSDEKVVLTDLGSLNGTYVNDTEVRIRELADDDIIEIGSYLIKYIDGSAEPGRVEAPAEQVLVAPTREDLLLQGELAFG